ncbi:MAG TPA: P1 family peptidase [Candidatus Latescibacteria bacterium]|nr:P1 family peptidase [Candidatus Latescibacterota bacterium]HJP32079.1 P1 family peptidase [Candidatus Latescibacterota bacterium]
MNKVHPGSELSRRRFLGLSLTAAALPALSCAPGTTTSRSRRVGERARLRDLGIIIGDLPTGSFNAITDVTGVRVGHTTLIRGDGPLIIGRGPVRTGVTAILPRPDSPWRRPVYAADLTINGNGEFTGLGPVRRTGILGGPILLTDTGSVGRVHDGGVQWALARDADAFDGAVRPDPVVGETWADFLNDTIGRHVGSVEVARALTAAADGPVAEGCVGGGTGMRAFQFKAGIGTSSRLVPAGKADSDGAWRVGVLVQANFGGRHQMVVNGVPVGRQIVDLLPERGGPEEVPSGNSLLIVIATDAPLLPVQLQRLCRRAAIGMGRTGAVSTHGSGDLAIAFSTGNEAGPAAAESLQVLHTSRMSWLHTGVVEATEEAILNSLTAATTMVGRDGNTIHALPLDRLADVMGRYGRLE